jgi:UDP:flavonoid glycosyltransferase YjiC (YdhE family)
MSYLSRAGVGAVLRSENAGVATVRKAVERLLNDPGYEAAVENAMQSGETCTSGVQFRKFVREILGDAG